MTPRRSIARWNGRAMNSRFIIISGILVQDPAQVRLPEYNHVVETFPSD
jgi:hypothetical protein